MKLVLKIFNLIYIVLAAVACVALFTKPIVSINASINAPKAQVSEYIYPMFEEQGIAKEDFDNALNKSLDKNGYFGFTMKLEVPAASIINKDASQITKSLTEQVNVSVDEIVNKLNPTIKELAKLMAKKAGKDAIKDSIAQQIKITNPESDANQIMSDCGIDDAYINNMTDDILNSLLGNPDEGVEAVQTVSELMDKIDDNIYDVCHKLSEGNIPGYEADGLDEKIASMNDDIEKQLQDALLEAKLCDEDGNIRDIDAAIDELLASFIDQLIGGESAEEKPAEENTEITEGEKTTEEHPAEDVKKTYVLRVDAEESSEEKESKLNQKIREFLNKKIEEFNINGIVEQYWFVPLIVTLGLMLPWVIFILITIIRTIRRSKCWTKSWIVFTFAIFQVVFGILLYLITAKFMGQILEIIPLPENPAVEILKASSLGIQTSAFIPSILYLAMIPLTIVYMILAHKVKKQYKEEKREKKAA